MGLEADVRLFAPTEGILTLGLHVDEFGRTVFTGTVLVGQSGLNYFFEPLALAFQFLHDVVLRLEGVLQVLHHALLDLFQLSYACFIGLTSALQLSSLLLVL